jgi:hypothetical protein
MASELIEDFVRRLDGHLHERRSSLVDKIVAAGCEPADRHIHAAAIREIDGLRKTLRHDLGRYVKGQDAPASGIPVMEMN